MPTPPDDQPGESGIPENLHDSDEQKAGGRSSWRSPLDHTGFTGIDINKILGLTNPARLMGPDWSKIAGVNFARFAGPDWNKLMGTDWNKFTGTDWGKIPGLTDFARFSGTDWNKIVGITDFSRFAGIDFGAVTGAAEFSRLTALDFSNVVQKNFGMIAGTTNFAKLAGLDFTRFTNADTFARLGGIDFGKLFKDLDLEDHRFYPPNWPTNVNLDLITQVINDDGLPIVWVPRQEIVELVLAAHDREARVLVLLDHTDQLIEDCRLVLDDIDEPSLVGQLPLATQALDAFAAGHGQAAQALAAVVTETVVAAALSRKYDKVRKIVQFDADEVPWNRLRLAAALGPIYRFYTSWWPSSGAPSPKELSRHVSVHHADVGHYTPGNALVAVLLVTSVLRGIQELQEGAAEDEAA